MTVYIEYVLIDNFVIDYLLLAAALKTAGKTAERKRLVLCSAIGALFSLIYPLLEVHAMLLAAIKLLMGILLVLLSCKFCSVKEYVIVSALFMGYTFLLGGAMIGVYSFLGLNYSSEICVAIAVIPAYMLIKCVYKVVRYVYRRKDIEGFIYKTDITVNGRRVSVNGFLDTGNGLYDGESPVVICNDRTARVFLSGKLPAMKRLSVGTVNGRENKIAFGADCIEVFTDGGVVCRTDVVLCVSRSGFETGYDVILHPALFSEKNKSVQKV